MNKTIVVTGGSKGIGKSIVFKFAKNGFDIITCSRSAKDLYSLESNFKSIYSDVKIFTFKADLSNKDDCDKFIRFVNKNTKYKNTNKRFSVFRKIEKHKKRFSVFRKMLF